MTFSSSSCTFAPSRSDLQVAIDEMCLFANDLNASNDDETMTLMSGELETKVEADERRFYRVQKEAGGVTMLRMLVERLRCECEVKV